MSEIRSVFDTVKSVYFFGRLFGTIPLKQTGNIYVPIKMNLLCTLYSIVLFIISVSHFVYAPVLLSSYYKRASNNTPRASKLVLPMKIISPMLSSCLTLATLLNSLICVRKGLGYFFQTLQEIDIILRRVQPVNSFGFNFSVILTLVTVLVEIPLAFVYMLYQFKSFGNLYWSLGTAFFIVLGFSSEIQFVNWSFLLYERFKSINRFLSVFLNSPTELAWIPTVYKPKPSWHLKPRSNKLFKNRFYFHEGTKLTVDKLELIHLCHKKLCELVNHLNRMYRVSILFSLGTCFFKQLIYVYFLIFGYTTSSPYDKKIYDSIWSMIYSPSWTLTFLFRFLMIIFSAGYTTTEALAVKSIISSINNRFLDTALKEELLLFLNHISNKKVSFSVCGFFKLNNKLITSALAAGTTYLVILIQFHPHIYD